MTYEANHIIEQIAAPRETFLQAILSVGSSFNLLYSNYGTDLIKHNLGELGEPTLPNMTQVKDSANER